LAALHAKLEAAEVLFRHYGTYKPEEWSRRHTLQHERLENLKERAPHVTAKSPDGWTCAPDCG
jgi:hypothetical protein